MMSHLAVSIDGIADRLLGKIPKSYGSWQILQDETGRFLTKDEVWKELKAAKLKGWEVIAACDFVDEKGHCKGHPDSPLPEKEEE